MKDVVSLSSIWTPVVSNDGNTFFYEIQEANWDENRFDTEIFQSTRNGEEEKITENDRGSSYSPKLSPSENWLAYFSDSENGRELIVLDRKTGNKSIAPKIDGSYSNFKWHPIDSKLVVLVYSELHNKDRIRGNYEIEDEYKGKYSLLTFEVDKGFQQEILVSEFNEQINNYDISYDGKFLAIEHQKDSKSISNYRTDISIIDLKSKQIEKAIANPGWDGLISWSPNSHDLLYHTYLENINSDFYKNVKLQIYSYNKKTSKQLAKDFDENIYEVRWTQAGIFGLAQMKTTKSLIEIDPITARATVVSSEMPYWSVFSASSNGKFLTYVAGDRFSLPELFVSDCNFNQTKKISNLSSQITGWQLPQSEIMSWLNSKGQLIEGVIRKPVDYDENKKYPVLTIVHGGPKATSWPEPVPTSIYPINQWAQEDVIIFQPNYRGSSGYGEFFRSGLERNFGDVVEDDILSGINALSKTIDVDSTRLGIMGWSFGGYISAYLSVKSDKFQAASVGAGITDWELQYYSTDEHQFTIQYLKTTPWEDKKVYNINSPMHYIQNAHTPTLIQHGENDKRVPITNALALYQGLEDYNVPVELIIYKGFGHRIVQPLERLAALRHNYQWFSNYLNLNSEKNKNNVSN